MEIIPNTSGEIETEQEEESSKLQAPSSRETPGSNPRNLEIEEVYDLTNGDKRPLTLTLSPSDGEREDASPAAHQPTTTQDGGFQPTSGGRAKKEFLICGAIALLILVSYNIVIHYVAASSQRRQLLTDLRHIPPTTDCLFVGNSLVEAGCDPRVFQSHWPQAENRPQPFNIALGATSPVEHYLILKHALERGLHAKYVIYGFFDDELNAPVKGDWSDLVGNRALSYYFPDEAAELYAPGSALKEWELRLASKVPMFSERSSLWGKVEVLREKFEDVGMPRRQKNRYGTVKNFSALEAKDANAFDQRCAAALSLKEGFSVPVQKIIQVAQQHGAQVIFVEMPMPTRHRKLFYSSPEWSKLRARLQSLAAQSHVVYVPASDWVKNDAEFEDVTHLSPEGAKDFSAQLARAVAVLPNLAQLPKQGPTVSMVAQDNEPH